MSKIPGFLCLRCSKKSELWFPAPEARRNYVGKRTDYYVRSVNTFFYAVYGLKVNSGKLIVVYPHVSPTHLPRGKFDHASSHQEGKT